LRRRIYKTNLYGKLGRESSKELQEMARKRNISTDKDVQSIQQGWEGKQKGLLQVLWERRWIDESKLDEYKIIKKDDEGIVVDDESLEVMLASCLDFADEITELQAKGEEMEVRVIPTTKFHAEMAGEGIEYLWGVGKGWYRSKPLELIRKKASFLQLVHDVLDPESARTKKRAWSFSKRARAYICAYYAFEKGNIGRRDNQDLLKETDAQDDHLEKGSLEYWKIEQMAKQFCTHRCAFYFDRGFCNGHILELKK
jgi:hypothetical protein